MRLIVRMLLQFLVEVVPPLARWHGGDLVGGVVFLVAVHAGRSRMARLAADSIVAALEPAKPISVNNIAASLGIPYETARRRVHRLIASGLVERQGPQAIVVPDRVLADPEFARFAAALQAAFVAMVRALRAIGFDFDSFARTVAADAADEAPGEPDFVIQFQLIGFLLRLIECGVPAHDNDLTRALVFGAIMAANAAPYTNEADTAWRFATLSDSPPEDIRRPIPVLALAETLGIPYETTRRCVGAMLRDGDIVRVGRAGVVNPRTTPRDAELHRTGALMLTRFAQLVGTLKRLGYNFETLAFDAKASAA